MSVSASVVYSFDHLYIWSNVHGADWPAGASTCIQENTLIITFHSKGQYARSTWPCIVMIGLEAGLRLFIGFHKRGKSAKRNQWGIPHKRDMWASPVINAWKSTLSWWQGNEISLCLSTFFNANTVYRDFMPLYYNFRLPSDRTCARYKHTSSFIVILNPSIKIKSPFLTAFMLYCFPSLSVNYVIKSYVNWPANS